MEETTTQEPTAQWAVVELFGHQVIVGEMSETEVAGHGFIRIDVPETGDAPALTKLYGPKAIYSITYVSEEVAATLLQEVRPKPVNVYSPALSRALSPGPEIEDEDNGIGPREWDDDVLL